MKEEKTKQEKIEESKLLFKVTTKPTKELVKDYYWYCVKKRFSLESKPFKIIVALILISLFLYFITNPITNSNQIEDKIQFIISLSIEIGIFLVLYFLIYRYKINKQVKKIDDNTKGTTTYFYKKGIIDKGENKIYVNEYEDIKSVDRNKDALYITYKNATATAIRYELLTPKQKEIINNIEASISSKKPIKKPRQQATEVEAKEKSKKTIVIIGLIAIYIVATLVGIVYLSDKEEETESKSQYIVNKYVDELEELQHADDAAYAKCKEFLDQQIYYINFHSSDYYLHGKDEYTLTIYANYTNEITLYYEVYDLVGTATCEWGEWYGLNGDNYTKIDLYVYPEKEGYSYIKITNDSDDKEIYVFVDNVNRDIVEFDTTFNHNIAILNEIDEENGCLNSRKMILNRIDDSHFLYEWVTIATSINRNRWYAVEDIDNFNKYPCTVWKINDIDNDNRIISIDELYFEDKPGTLKYKDITDNKKEIKLSFNKDDQGFYEVLNSEDKVISTFTVDEISGSLSVNVDSIEIYNEPNGETVKTYKLNNDTLFVNLIRAEKGETWYRIGKDMWVKAQPSIEYFNYSKTEEESEDQEEHEYV